MGRYTESVCRLCRRENTKLFLKGERCFTEKCAVERRSYAPGQHGRRRGRVQGYGIQLREKQKVKRIYGLGEKQFRLYFSRAERQQGKTGDNLLIMLERRLDNVVYRSGFASSRAQARQLISHGHLRVDDHKVDIPSFLVKGGHVVAVREKSRKNPYILEALDITKSRGCPRWLELDGDKLQSTVKELPQREDISTIPIQEQLIVELYSK